MSVGPIDFAKRRETIKLAYSKTILERQAQEARDAAAEKGKREREMINARRKPETEISAEEVEAIGTHSTAPAADQASDGSVHDGSIQAQSAPRERVVHAEPLRIVTNVLGHGSAVAGPLKGLESPMLGIPGSFPALLSPRREEVDMPIPRSATSTTSMATEFDVEPQTEPPTQTATATTVETLSMTVKEPQPVATEREDGRPAPHRRSSYHSPFDMEEMSDDNASIRIALDTSAEQPSARPTPSRGELGAETQPKPASEAEPEIGHQVEADPGPELERAIPATSHEEYEARPYAYTSSTYETTVTILGPETDFRPSHSKGHVGVTTPETNELETIAETREAAVPAERLPADVELAEAAPARYAPQPHNAEQEPAAAPEERLENPEEFYVGPTLHDNVAALREATLALSDGDTSCDAPLSSAECQKTPDTSHSLTVPPLLSPANRLSQLSAWTDFSLESSDGRGTSARGSVVYLQEPEIREQSSMKSTQSRESSLQERHDAEASPLDSTGTIDADKPLISDAYLAQHRLPELNTGGGFAVPYCSTGHLRTSSSLSRSLLPSHAPPPPPPPPSSEGYVADEDVYNLDTRRSSFVRSQDGEDDDDRGPQSSSHSTAASVSVQHSELPSTAPSERNMSMSESQEPSEKERKRLQQRQLVIRELIDTEAIFIRDMTVVEEIYKGTAEACPNLDDKTVKLIFRNSDDVIAFHTVILAQLKEGVATVYAPKGRKLPLLRGDSVRDQDAESVTGNSVHAGSVKAELRDENDRMTMIGCAFIENIDKLKAVHETYLRSSDQSTKRLLQIQEDPTVKVWLDECNEVAKDLTSAWNLDSLLIKPMQRITKYPDLLTHLLKYTPDDHPDREPLMQSRTMIMDAIDEINKAKKNFELVGQIVSSRKRKDSDVRLGLARAFGKRVDKLQASKGPPEDEVYLKHQERFGDDYLRLQVVLRDVEYYTRTISAYVHEFLQYLSSIELVMRLQPSKEYAHIESKWVQFNVSMRDMEKVALERHLSDIRRHVIEPFEQVIRCYANPSEAMRKRAKRRVDYEKYVQLKAGNKKIDKQLAELNEQYEALNETLKKELPRLSALTAQVGNICLGKFVSIQTDWFRIWQAKMKMPLQDAVEHVPEVPDIVSAFQRDFRDVEEAALAMPILNPLSTVPSSVMGRTSSSQQSILTTTTTDDAASTFSKGARSVGRSEGLSVSSSVHGTPRGRGLSVTSDYVPSLPTPDFLKRHSAGFAFTTTTAMSSPNMGSGGGFGVSHGNGNGMLSSPGHYYRDYHNGTNGGANAPDVGVAGSAAGGAGGGGFSRLHPRPGSIRSYESSAVASAAGTSTTTRKSSESATPYRRDSNPYHLPGGGADGGGGRRFSGLFHSALPLPEGGAAGTEEGGSQRASSRERGAGGARYNVLWLAASLFEFNIETTKHEAGYPYLTYQAGEVSFFYYFFFSFLPFPSSVTSQLLAREEAKARCDEDAGHGNKGPRLTQEHIRSST